MKLRRLLFVSLLLLVAVPLAVRAQTPDEKTLVVAQSVDISGMEPNMISSRAEANIANEIFGTLYEVNSKGAIVPYLANDFKESADGKELTFTLNEGLTCHDGEALTAEDVAYTFNRAADPANKFNGNTPGFVFDALKFKSAKADDDLHVTLTIGDYSPIALGLLAEVYIHCKDSYEKMSLEEAAKNPIGSGPYKWVEWKKDEYVLLEKFAGFTLRPANFDKVYWRVIPEASTRVAELIAGNVDIIGNVSPDQIPAIDGSGTASSIAVSGTRRMYVGFNFSDKFKDAPGWDAIMKKDVRVALQYAVDVPTICKTLLGTDCDRAASMVNPPNDNPDIKPYPYDPVKAGELLDAAGYPLKDGIRFEITLQGPRGRYLNDANVVQAIGQYLTDAGVKTTVELTDWSDYRPKAQAHENGPMFFLGTGGDTWSAIYDMADITEPKGSTNYTEWPNEEWFKLWNSLSGIRDQAEQRKVTNTMLQIMHDDSPWLFLYFQPDFYGKSNRINWEAEADKIYLYTAALK